MDEMDPRMLGFIKQHITTFTRWDVIKFLHNNPNTQDTAERLAQYVGRSVDVIQQESEALVTEGIFRSARKGTHTVYTLGGDQDIRQIIAYLVEAAHDRTFRMKLVYHILRAGGQE
jgi:hypothetical protein